MNKYRIHIDPPLPDRDRIAGYQDFDALYGQYQTHTRFEFWRNLYRKPRNFALLVMAVAVGVLVFRAEEKTQAERPYRLFPAATQLDVPPQTQALDPAQPHDLRLSPEVQLHIPAAAWQDSSGELVEGAIALHHRVLIGPEEAFVAGVPRPHAQSAIQALHLVDVYATQEGRRLQLREGYPLRVSWQLAQKFPQLAVQQLDEAKQRWIPLGNHRVAPQKAEARPKPERPAILDQRADTLIAKGAKAPTPPGRPFGVALSNPDAYPEFQQYQKVYWEPVPRPGTVDPWEAGLIQQQNGWEDVSVRNLPLPGLYELRFARVNAQGGMEMKRVAARPVFEAENDAEAQRIWEQRKAAYQRALVEHQRQDSMLRVQQDRVAAARRIYQADLAAWEAAQAEYPDAPSEWGLSYNLEKTGVSGYWDLSAEVEWGEGIDLPEAEESDFQFPVPALTPWCYAVSGGRWWPLAITDQEVRLPASAPDVILWWEADGVAYRWKVADQAAAIERRPLSDLSDGRSWIAWLNGMNPDAL